MGPASGKCGNSPLVSFVVPCYRMAHLLPECVHSILSQSYQNFEILIMDDCSPDDTPVVARSFRDPRISHIRNEENLGHLRNYNKGISLAEGRYIWLISADDVLRRPYVLERYVTFMEQHPAVGYTICPAVGLVDGRDTGILDYSWLGGEDNLLDGRRFLLTKLIGSGCIAAPTAMARKECYTAISMFPLDMPHQGDIYLWSCFALHYDVGYFAEPMVYYRQNQEGMEHTLRRRDPRILFRDNVGVLWRLSRVAAEAGFPKVVERCFDYLAIHYSFRLRCHLFDQSTLGLSSEEFEKSLAEFATCESEARRVRSGAYSGLGDGCYVHGDFKSARRFYRLALDANPWLMAAWLKFGLLASGAVGRQVRSGMAAVRHLRGR